MDITKILIIVCILAVIYMLILVVALICIFYKIRHSDNGSNESETSLKIIAKSDSLKIPKQKEVKLKLDYSSLEICVNKKHTCYGKFVNCDKCLNPDFDPNENTFDPMERMEPNIESKESVIKTIDKNNKEKDVKTQTEDKKEDMKSSVNKDVKDLEHLVKRNENHEKVIEETETSEKIDKDVDESKEESNPLIIETQNHKEINYENEETDKDSEPQSSDPQVSSEDKTQTDSQNVSQKTDSKETINIVKSIDDEDFKLIRN